MAQVLVLEPDHDVRAALGEALDLDGHRVLMLAETFQALSLLRSSATALVVIAGNQGPRNESLATFFDVIVHDERLVGNHHYICLTTTPDAIPNGLRAALTKLCAPLLAKPFALDELLDAVRRITAVSSTATPRHSTCPRGGRLP